MAVDPDFAIEDAGPLSAAARAYKCRTFAEIAEAVRSLPYGRVSDSTDVLAVLHEGRGTCSGKHRFLAALAHECGRTEVQLMLGLYEMSEANTPGVGIVLGAVGLASIPEAHCYLLYRGKRLDFTGLPASLASPFDSLLEERTVAPADLPVAKPAFHREAIARWARSRGMDPEHAWNVREACIAALASA